MDIPVLICGILLNGKCTDKCNVCMTSFKTYLRIWEPEGLKRCVHYTISEQSWAYVLHVKTLTLIKKLNQIIRKKKYGK